MGVSRNELVDSLDSLRQIFSTNAIVNDRIFSFIKDAITRGGTRLQDTGRSHVLKVGLAHVKHIFSGHDILHPDVSIFLEASTHLGDGSINWRFTHPANIGILQVRAIVGAQLRELVWLVDQFMRWARSCLYSGGHGFIVGDGGSLGNRLRTPT